MRSERRITCVGLVVGLSMTAALLARAEGATIPLTLLNPSFETSVSVLCPNSWTCTGSPGAGFGSYAPGIAQFTPGSDGLGSGSVPNGSNASYSPTGLAGAGTLKQSDTTLAGYVPPNVYVFDFWVGLPKKEPDGTTTVNGFPETVIISWTLGGVGAGLCDGWGTARLSPLTGSGATQNDNSADCQFPIPSPGAGQWQQWHLTYTSIFGRTGNPGVAFQVSASSTGQPKEVNFDVGPNGTTGTTAVPEPWSLVLVGTGLLVLTRALRQVARRK